MFAVRPPAQDLVVKGFDSVEGTVVKEVPFDIPDHILDLSLAFRIGFPAEVQAEGLFARIGPERIGEDKIPAVFTDHEHFILVIDHFHWDTPDIGKGFLVGLYSQQGGKVLDDEPYVFKPGAGKCEYKEKHFYPIAGCVTQVVFAKIYLSLFSIGELCHHLIFTGTFDEGQVMLAPFVGCTCIRAIPISSSNSFHLTPATPPPRKLAKVANSASEGTCQ